MREPSQVPRRPLDFIRRCIEQRKILWTYHVNVRLARRSISRETLIASTDTLEIIEFYPDDRFLPSYLLLGRRQEEIFHVLIAVDSTHDNIRIVTMYHPDRKQWMEDLKTRRGGP